MLQMKQLLAKTKGDKIIWGVVILLSLISLLVVYSSTGLLAYKREQSASHYLIKQLMILALGLFIIYRVHKINYTKFAKVASILYVFSLPLLLLTLIFGSKVHNSSRFIMLPIINISFQSSDLAKLALFMFLARTLSIKQPIIENLKQGFFPVLFPMILTCVLIAPSNLSTALMLGITCFILFFIGRVKFTHLLLLIGIGIVTVTLIYVLSIATGYGRGTVWKKRVNEFFSAGKQQNGKEGGDFQVQQAKIAIANGGFTGLGPGNSIQRNNLPFCFSDFIYAIIIEEYGLLGGGFVIALYLIFLWRSIIIFKRCPYAFGAFLAVGLSITLVFQAMLNMAVTVHIVPVTGLTLPMISMGGSSIWFTSIAIGIILSVSRYVDEMEGEKRNDKKVVSKLYVQENKEPKKNPIVVPVMDAATTATEKKGRRNQGTGNSLKIVSTLDD